MSSPTASASPSSSSRSHSGSRSASPRCHGSSDAPALASPLSAAAASPSAAAPGAADAKSFDAASSDPVKPASVTVTLPLSSPRFLAAHASASAAPLPGAYYALSVMTLLNLLNYCDRFVPSACKGLIASDLHLSDVQTALPMGAFLLIYMLTSPIFGYLADQGHVKRTALIGAGVFLWSLATTAGAFATDFTTFLLARAAVGVGEAAYATIAPALLCDFFPVASRPKVLSFFYLAIPVGAALGYAVAGEIGEQYGWRASFLVCGIPGMLLVLLVLGMREPPRGTQDAAALHGGAPVAASAAALSVADSEGEGESSDDTVGWPEALQSLMGNAHYMHALGAVTLVSFASGGIADWLPTWLVRVQHIDVGTAGTLVGAITCVAGIGGSLSGYVIGEWLDARGVRNAYFVVGALSQLVTCLFSAALLVAGTWASLPETACLIFVCQFCMWLNVGGCSAVIANSVDVKIRSRAFGLSILISHLGGDAISPSLIGAISDESGGNLSTGFSVVPVAFGLAALLFAYAAHNLREGHGADTVGMLPAGKSLSDDIELRLHESPRSANASAATEFATIETDTLEAEV